MDDLGTLVAPHAPFLGDRWRTRHCGTHRPNPAWTQGFRPSSPSSTLPMDYDERFKREMMETDTAVGCGDPRHRRARRPREPARARLPRRLDARHRPGARRGPAARQRRPARARGDGHGAVAAHDRAGRRWRARARSSCPRSSSATSCGSCRRRRSRSRIAPEDGVASIESGSYSSPRQRLRRRGLPAPAVDRRAAAGGRGRRRCSTPCSACRAPRRATSRGRC